MSNGEGEKVKCFLPRAEEKLSEAFCGERLRYFLRDREHDIELTPFNRRQPLSNAVLHLLVRLTFGQRIHNRVGDYDVNSTCVKYRPSRLTSVMGLPASGLIYYLRATQILAVKAMGKPMRESIVSIHAPINGLNTSDPKFQLESFPYES